MAAGFIKDAKGVELNPEKYVFRVPRGMFLGFVVSKRGIEANPEKITTIVQHPEPLLGTPGGCMHPWGGPLGTSNSYVASTLKMFSSCSYTSLPREF
jgi:hypothetical protein